MTSLLCCPTCGTLIGSIQVKQAPPTDDLKAAAEQAQKFLTECTIRSIGGRILTTELRSSYMDWCRAEGRQVVSGKRFGMALRECGVDSHRSHGLRYYLGLVPI